MTTYQSRLKSREEVAEGTMAFHLEKPAGFQFKAGQYLDVTLINPPEIDSQGVVRTFSIASAPYENELLVATPDIFNLQRQQYASSLWPDFAFQAC